VKTVQRTAYLGAFCEEVKTLIRSECRPELCILNLCSGSWDFGITLDKSAPANIKGDVCWLPFKNSIADLIIFDPPFSKKLSAAYNAYLSNRRVAFREIIRILKPGGLLIFSHYFIPPHKIWHLEKVYLIHNRPWEKVRVLSFLRKRGSLFDFYAYDKTPSPRELSPPKLKLELQNQSGNYSEITTMLSPGDQRT